MKKTVRGDYYPMYFRIEYEIHLSKTVDPPNSGIEHRLCYIVTETQIVAIFFERGTRPL